jgi:hypothetical protein
VPVSISNLPRDSTIQIIVADEVSQITVFEGPTPLSEVFSDTITVRGKATLRVFVNGQLVEERGL